MTTQVDVETAKSAPDVRAREVEEQMTDEERLSLVIGVMGQLEGFNPVRDERIPEGTTMSAGYTPGVPRLGVPALQMSDASMGVTNPGYVGREGDTATAMPACIAPGASFNPALARAAGGAIGREARSRGFNVQLAGGINLARDPRNGRNFEYLSRTPGTALSSPPSRSTGSRPTNAGDRAGADLPQLYLTEAAGDERMRLLGFERVELQPREARSLTVTADPRLLARFDGHAGQWLIDEARTRSPSEKPPTTSP
jgi:hypothetical protein